MRIPAGITVLAATLLCCGSVLEGSPKSGTINEVASAKSFAFGGIGVAGTMSEGERALRAVLQREDASKQLQGALGHASLAGQLYILVGLRRCDPDAYREIARTLPRVNDEAETIGGCIITPLPFRQVVSQIEAGRYDQQLSRPPW
jgi:hypothetical protein